MAAMISRIPSVLRTHQLLGYLMRAVGASAYGITVKIYNQVVGTSDCHNSEWHGHFNITRLFLSKVLIAMRVLPCGQ